MTYRDLSAFFTQANYGAILSGAPLSRDYRYAPAWAECCTNGRCNSCK